VRIRAARPCQVAPCLTIRPQERIPLIGTVGEVIAVRSDLLVGRNPKRRLAGDPLSGIGSVLRDAQRVEQFGAEVVRLNVG
jgi:hypothetical protein